MIGRFFGDIILLTKGYRINNLVKNSYFEIKENKIIFFKKAYVLIGDKIELRKEIDKEKFQKAVISDTLNKDMFLNSLIYNDGKFIYLLKNNFKFNCKKFRTRFELIKEAEKFFSSFLDKVINKEEFILVFSELFFNAYEHGNMNLSFEEKEELIKKDKYVDFVKKGNEKEIEVCVSVTTYKNKKFLVCKITDEGEGFDIYKQFDSKYNGRGIILSQKFCKALFYNEKGNSVMFIKEIK